MKLHAVGYLVKLFIKHFVLHELTQLFSVIP